MGVAMATTTTNDIYYFCFACTSTFTSSTWPALALDLQFILSAQVPVQAKSSLCVFLVAAATPALAVQHVASLSASASASRAMLGIASGTDLASDVGGENSIGYYDIGDAKWQHAKQLQLPFCFQLPLICTLLVLLLVSVQVSSASTNASVQVQV